jgi:hypothetical protein
MSTPSLGSFGFRSPDCGRATGRPVIAYQSAGLTDAAPDAHQHLVVLGHRLGEVLDLEDLG